jgi:hypothetical protein
MSDTPPCPKCSGATDDIGSKYVCGECYWVFDKGGPAPKAGKVNVPTPQVPKNASTFRDPKAPLATFSQPASAPAPVAPGTCPKCGSKTTDIGGKFVCDECYWVIDQPSTAAAKTSPFAPRPAADATEDGALSPKAIAGVALIILLILMIVILAIRH